MYLIVGRRGSGKTLLATEMAIGRMRKGERVYANYAIEDVERGLRSGVIYSLLDCLTLNSCTVVVDEANLWTSSRQWSKIPAEVLSSWAQSRKRGLSFIFTAQHEERVDKIIRELSDWVLLCERPGVVPRWVPLFRVQWTYLEEIGQVRRGALGRAEYRWVPHRVFAGYGTHDLVNAEMLADLERYQAAIKAGDDPDELGLALPSRIEPSRFVDGEWRTWDYTASGDYDIQESPRERSSPLVTPE